MNREMLKGLGLDDETINKIMIENGKDIEKAKAGAEELKSKLAKAEETIQAYEKEDIEGLKKEASEFRLKAGYLEEELTQTRNEALLDKNLASVNTHDLEMLKKALDMEKIEYKDGEISGLNEQIEALKESKAYLFKEEASAETEQPSIQGVKSYEPGTSGASGVTGMQAEIEAVFNN